MCPIGAFVVVLGGVELAVIGLRSDRLVGLGRFNVCTEPRSEVSREPMGDWWSEWSTQVGAQELTGLETLASVDVAMVSVVTHRSLCSGPQEWMEGSEIVFEMSTGSWSCLRWAFGGCCEQSVLCVALANVDSWGIDPSGIDGR